MAYKIKGILNISGKLKVLGKYVGNAVKTSNFPMIYKADTNGNLTIPILNKSQIDYIFKEMPVTQYGSLSYFPVGVGGTYNGGTAAAYTPVMPSILENDGTFVFLRPGTNGSTVNYYYSYCSNPTSSITPTSTVKPYYEGNSKNILFYDSYVKDVMLYEELDNHILHVVLTNGTLNKESHIEATFPRTMLTDIIMSCSKIGNYVYIVTMFNSSFNYNLMETQGTPPGVGNEEVKFKIYRIPVSQIVSGNITTVENVQNISGTTMYGDVVSSYDGIKLADKWISNTATTDKSFIKFDTGISIAYFTYTIYGSAKSYFNGTELIFSFFPTMVYTNIGSRKSDMYGFTVKYNPSTNQYTHDLTDSPITVSGSSTTPTSIVNPYSITSATIYGNDANIPTSVGDGFGCSWFITDSGTQYALKERHLLQEYYIITRSTIGSFINKTQAYTIRGRTLTMQDSKRIMGDYASRAGDQLMGGTPISATRLIFSGTGTYNGIQYGRHDRGIADIGTTRNYTYTSLSRGTIQGYAPQVYRVPVLDESLFLSKVSYHNMSDGFVETYGTVFTESFTTAGYKIDPTTLQFDRMISINSSLLTTLKNDIVSAQGSSDVTFSRIALYYSPKTDYMKSLAVVITKNSAGGGFWIVANVNCTMVGNNITACNFDSIQNVVSDNTINSIGDTISFQSSKCGLSCVKYSDFTYTSFSSMVGAYITGNTKFLSYAGKVQGDYSLSNITSVYSYHSSHLYSPTFREYSYLPNFGFGFYTFNNTDYGTKMIFKNCGNTNAQFDSNLVSGTGTDLVVLAQDVASGFILYFTEVTPLFMGGQYFEIPITTIDLSTIKSNPANTLYYAYVRLKYGTPSYVISLVELPETTDNIFIGTLQTDATKISSLNINKVSKFDNYRSSETQIGSAFPVSTGNPVQPGSIAW